MKKAQMQNEDSMSTAKNKINRAEALSRQILDYLQKHPEASDTLEGIADWWLEQQQINNLVEEVAEALELLIEKGILSAQKNLSGITTYKIKNDK